MFAAPTNPASPWWIWLLLCCWPAPGTIIVIALLTTAVYRGWFQWLHISVDRSKMPKFNWRRNE